MEATAPSFPPVVAVVVTADPGPWFEQSLTALAEQDYPGLSVLVIDDASAEDPTPRVAAILPHAYVRRRSERGGFGAAADEVLEVVEGASHFLFCHDDIALEPGAIRTLLEESFRSNAGIVGPKLVDWEDRQLLLQVGLSCDKFGTPSSNVERHELDQEQHDAVREVFVIPGGCQLIRADLFRALGGFDPAINMFGEDLDLCWRAQVAGARVVVVPDAVARHAEVSSSARRGDGPDPLLERRHRLRAVLKSYSRFHLIRVLPQLIVVNVVEAVYSLASGRTTSRAIAGAWRWNLARWGDIRRARHSLAKQRQVPDGEVRRLQVSGSARVTNFVRGELGRPDRSLAATREALVAPLRGSVALLIGWIALFLALLFGSRGLIGGRLPAIGQLGPFPSTWSFFGHFLSGWRSTGLGSTAPAPAAFGVLGTLSLGLLGATAQLQKLLFLGCLPIGLFGVFRATKALASRRARLVSVVAYAALPLPYNAMASGRLAGTIAYAAAPWIFVWLLREVGAAPFTSRSDSGNRRAKHAVDRPRPWTRALPLGLLLAAAGSVVPSLPIAAVVVAAALAAGGLVAGRVEGGLRGLTMSLVAVGIAIVLLLPWTLDLILPGALGDSITGPGPSPAAGLRFVDALRFRTGPVGAGPIGFALLAAALLPLLVGQSWRLQSAIRCWAVSLVLWTLAWAGGRGWLGPHVLPADVLLAFAGVALALSVGLGLVAFESDVTGHRLGWRQSLSVGAAIALGLAWVPVLNASVHGRWGVPRQDFSSLLAPTAADRAARQFRILWLGAPAVLPLGSWRLSDGVAYATSDSARPDVLQQLPPSDNGATGLLADAVNLARAGLTSRLGHLVAPMAVRYIVVPRSLAPDSEHTRVVAPPADVPAALAAQTDLQAIEGDVNLLVYENSAWVAQRAALSRESARAAQAGGLRSGANGIDATPALPVRRDELAFSGPVRSGQHIYLAETASSGWHLRVGGRSSARTRDFGWANGFDAAASGGARLSFSTPIVRRVAPIVEALVWLVAIRFLWRTRRRGEQP
jgi:GT2 family glycosyltransferase